jgi:hypothetical protein
MLTTIESALNESTVAVGTGPESPANVTSAPAAKPNPEIVIVSLSPETITPSLIDATSTLSGCGVTVGVSAGVGAAVGVGVGEGVAVGAGAGVAVEVGAGVGGTGVGVGDGGAGVGAGTKVGVTVGGTDVLVGRGVALGVGVAVARRRGVLVGVGVSMAATMVVGEGPISGVFASTALNTEICAPTKTTVNPPSSVPITTDTVKKPGAS